MKKVTIIIIALFVPLIMYAQDIDYAEYFIDSDPGYGLATPIVVSASGTDISLDFSASMTVVTEGIHYLVIRARDDMGRWSMGANQVFYRVPALDISDRNISRAEYFIDTDPGFGMAVSIPVSTPGNELSLLLSPDLLDLEEGIHYIHFRACDVSGRWGSGVNTIFLMVKKPSSGDSDIMQVEYFFDTDPGYGLGTPVTLPSSGSDLTIDFNATLTGLDDGNHVLYIRAKNELNKWGQVYAEGFAYSATGIGQEGINSLFKIYPNPTSGIVQVELTDQAQDEFRIRLMDLNGKLVYETECQGKLCEINLELPGGMYLMNIESAGGSITQKIILE